MLARRFVPMRLLALFGLLFMLQPLASTHAHMLASRTAATYPDHGLEGAAKIDPTDTELALYIVQLNGAPLAIAPNLPRRSDSARRDAKPDLESPQASAYEAVLDAERASTLTTIQRTLGQRVDPVYTYDTAFNGMALRLNGAQAARIAALPEVRSIEREQVYELTTDAGPAWIGADTIWDASTTGIFAATIMGANQVPPVASPATGRGLFNLTSSTLSYNIVVTGFTEAVTAAHLHRRTDGSVVASLTPSGVAGIYNDSIVLAPADLALLPNDDLYVDFHTATNPSGEIRGNISGYKGEGVVVGVLDTGINTTHPSFAQVGGDGYRHLNPRGLAAYRGACDVNNLPSVASGNPSGYNPAIQCNPKLIGAWTFEQTAVIPSPAGEPSPNDSDGHGSHTASTAAGNVLLNVSLNGAIFPRISGVAPHANVIAYDVCGYLSNGTYSGSCPGATLLAGANQAIADGVDVINFSISGGTSPWTDSVEIAFRNARAAGIVVAASAGNNGPTPGTVGHVSPWLMTVAASTHNRTLANRVTNLSADGPTSLPDMTGVGTAGSLSTSTPLVYAGSPAIGNALCAAFTPAQQALITGRIVVCDRGTFGRVEKAQNVQTGGGVGYVLANDAGNGNSLVADAYPIPGVHISFNNGVTLKNWIAANTNPTARISGTVSEFADAKGDIMASFSSRGPRTGAVANVLKPDLAAPGVDILAAVANTNSGTPNIGLLSGTSMASPHAAGAAALLSGLHPTWTPGQIQSALMTTGLAPITKEDGATPTTPFDSGAGRIRLERAAIAGLVLDETITNFTNANPANGGDPRTLNTPSMADPACVVSCAWTRTVRNTLPVPVTWTAATDSARLTVEPASSTIPAGGTWTFTVTYDAAGLPTGGAYVFGRVTLSATGGVVPDAAFPVAARPVTSDLPSSMIYTAPSGVDSSPRSFKTIAYSGLTIQRSGMIKGTVKNLSLTEGQTDITTLTVPANTARLVADIRSSTSLDVDIFVYRDDGDATFESGVDVEVCSSATGAVLEYCDLTSPAPSTYFVSVENFTASGGAGDPIKLVTAVVPQTNANNMVVTFPATSAGGTIGATIGVNEPGSQVGDIWYGQFSLTDAGSATSLGTTNFDFRHILGWPNTLAAEGTPQSTVVGAAFATPLSVVVTDSASNPLEGVTVSFSAPATGARATLSAPTATTDAAGRASVTATAGQIAGAYSVTASADGASGPVTATFNLTNTAGPAAQLEVAGGTPQTALVGVDFAQPLRVTVKDSFGNLVAGTQVSFSAPATGARATLSAATALTNASGQASVTATAGQIAGTYSVTASAAGAPSVSFSLTNTEESETEFKIYLPLIPR